MLNDLEWFRGSSRRPWLVIVGVVVLCTLAGIWGLRRLEDRAAPPVSAEAAAGGETAVTPAPTGGATALQPPATGELPPELARQLTLAQADEQADRLV